MEAIPMEEIRMKNVKLKESLDFFYCLLLLAVYV